MHRGLPEGNTKLVLILFSALGPSDLVPGLPEFLPKPASLAPGLHGYASSAVTRSHAPESTCMHMI